MKDIADDLGLSVVTVSKVLRDHPDIGEETRERVLRRVREVNYQPNILARSLVTGRSYLIGLVVPDLIHPFFAEVAQALSTAIRAKGYSLIITSSEEDQDLEAREIRHLQARRLDALVVASTRVHASDFADLSDDHLVLIDRDVPGLSANYVGIDDEAAGRMATEHLIGIGCRRIAHIRGRENSTGLGRHEGYRKALLASRLDYSEQYVVNRNKVDVQSTEQGYEAMRMLLRLEPRPDGVFCYNDPMAIGAMNAILDAGFGIPEDIAVIGCGNLHYNNWLRVPLSSIDQHNQQIGQRAAELALSLIESKQKPRPRSCILDPALVVRSSTQRAPADRCMSAALVQATASPFEVRSSRISEPL